MYDSWSEITELTKYNNIAGSLDFYGSPGYEVQ